MRSENGRKTITAAFDMLTRDKQAAGQLQEPMCSALAELRQVARGDRNSDVSSCLFGTVN